MTTTPTQTIQELYQKLDKLKQKLYDRNKAKEILDSFTASSGTSCTVVILDLWVDCPWSVTTQLIGAHFDKLEQACKDMANDIGVAHEYAPAKED